MNLVIIVTISYLSSRSEVSGILCEPNLQICAVHSEYQVQFQFLSYLLEKARADEVSSFLYEQLPSVRNSVFFDEMQWDFVLGELFQLDQRGFNLSNESMAASFGVIPHLQYYFSKWIASIQLVVPPQSL